MRACELLRKDRQLRRGASGRGGWLEAADDRQRVSPAVRFRAERKRRKEIDVTAGSEHRRKIECRGQDTDDGDRLIIQGEGTAEDGGIGGKAPFPQTVARARRSARSTWRWRAHVKSVTESRGKGLAGAASSFMPQRYQGIEPRSAPGRNVARGDRDEHEDERDRANRHRIVRRHVVEQRRDEPREPQRASHAER